MSQIWNRLYADYFMRSRLGEYERLIETALSNGYEHTSIIDFYDTYINGQTTSRKYFVRRHDVDTDIKTAEEMFRIEQRLGVKSTFYFRLSTLDISLMKEIQASGSEASYHFEEVAQVAKEKHLKTVDEVYQNMPYIQQRFEDNFTRLTKALQYQMRSVASHGDFVNRKLKLHNYVLMNESLRSKFRIDLEAYDSKLLKNYDVLISDMIHPQYYKPTNPFNVLKLGEAKVVYLLTHPRHWRSNPLSNTVENVKRIYEGLKYGLG